MSRDGSYSWRREAPWIVAIGVSALGARWPALQHPEVLYDSDNVLGPLMARQINAGGYYPLMLDGQDYLGSLEAYLGAPLEAAMPGDPRAWIILQIAIMALFVLPLLYRFCHLAGGRAGAVCGSLCLALGAPWQLAITAAAPLGYLTNLGLGLLVLMATLKCLERPSPGRLFGLGLAIGLGWWNNPQIGVFAGAAFLGLWTQGRLFALRAQGGLGAALAGRLGLAVKVLLFGALAFFLAVVALPFVGEIQLGPISLSRPHKYFPRGVAALAGALVLAELFLAIDHKAWLARAASWAGGAGLGLAPLVAYRIRDEPTKVKPWMRFELNRVVDNWPDFHEKARNVLVGDLPAGLPGRSLYTLAALILGGCVLGLIWRHRRPLAALIRLRAAPLPPAALGLLPGIALSVVYLLRGGFLGGERHYLILNLTLAVLVGAGVGALAARARLIGGAVCGAVVVLLLASSARLPAHLEALERTDHRELIEGLRARGVTRGYGQFWTAFHVSYLSGGEPLLACAFDPMGNMNRFRGWEAVVAEADHPVVVFDNADRPDGRWEWRQRWLGEHGFQVTDRWRFGERFLVLRFSRR